MRDKKILCACASVGVVAWAVASGAFAQDRASAPAVEQAAKPAAAEAAEAESIEEVVVFARKRSETVIDAPLAITAMGPEAVRQQSVVSFQDLSRVAPNVVLRQSNSGGGTVDAIIRGQSLAISNIANDAPVGFYFDDVIAAQGKGAAVGIFDIQSIEVARGVQGTLKGRNNTGGAISIYTHRPELGKFSGELSGTYGSRDYIRAEAILNVPVGEIAALRLGYQSVTQDAQGRSTWTGQGFGGRDQWIFRASALVQPNDNFSWHTVYEHTEIDQDPIGRRSLPGGATYNALLTGTRTGVNSSGLLLTPSQIIPSDFWSGSAGYVMANDYADIDFVRSTVTYRLSDALTFKVVAGYRELIALGGIDLDATPALNLESVNGGTSHQTTVEPQISGEFMGGKLNYVAGYYHFFDRGQLVADTFAYAVNAANPATPIRNHIFIREGGTNISDAGYAHLEFKPTERLELAGGLRFTQDVRKVRPLRTLINLQRQPVVCLFASPGVVRPTNGSCPIVELEKTYNYWSYELTAKYAVTDDLNVYARHGLGQKSGGINVPVPSTAAAPFEPEKVRDYEVGLKAARLLDGALDMSVALYYSDYSNLQRYVSTLVPGGGGIASFIINAGAATIKGVEADFNWRLTDSFRITGFVGYTDAEYDRFTTTDPAGALVDLANQPFVSAPKWTGRIGAVYERPLASGTLQIAGGYNYQGNSSLGAISFPGAESGKVNLVDARVSWTTDDRLWEVAVYGTNLLNDKYFTAATVNRAGVSPLPSSATAAYGNPGEKRFVGVSLTRRWE